MTTTRCTEQFLTYTVIGAVCQLLSTTTTLDFGFGTTPPTAHFSLSQIGVEGECRGRVQLRSMDTEFMVVSIEAPMAILASLTPVLRRALGSDEQDRTVVEMAARFGEACYRIHRSLFAEMITVHTS